MSKKAKTNAPPLMLSPAVCGFPSPAEQYVDAPLDLSELVMLEAKKLFGDDLGGVSVVYGGGIAGSLQVAGVDHRSIFD